MMYLNNKPNTGLCEDYDFESDLPDSEAHTCDKTCIGTMLLGGHDVNKLLGWNKRTHGNVLGAPHWSKLPFP